MVQKVEFLNAAKLPLNKLFFSVKYDGVKTKIPALSEHWIEKRCYTKYKPLPIVEGKIEEGTAITEWLCEADYFNKDLEFLLKLPHFKFWSHIIYDKKCMEAILSFFQEATPCYINICSATKNRKVLPAYLNIYNNAFRIVCRIITNKESEEEWITKEHLQELLYSKFIISIPLIFDLIITYGRVNREMLSRVIQTIFRIEPKYLNDLRLSLQYFQTALKTIQRKTETEEIVDENSPDINTLDDLALYTLDCALTISILTEILPQAKSICNELKMEQSISKFYENAIPLLYKNIYTIDSNSSSLLYLNKARMEFLKTFKVIINLHIENILKNPEESIQQAENYISTLTECLADRTFVIDFQTYFPIEQDIDILKQACPNLDHFKVDFIFKAYTSEGEAFLLDMIKNDNQNSKILDKKSVSPEPSKISTNESTKQNHNRIFEEEILAVKEVFPDLGDGFINRLLSRYDNSEQVIAAILEGNLPPDLETADRKEVLIPPDPQDTLFMETGIKRYNVFDGDQYDIMTNDNPNCIIKANKGFPNQPKNMKQLLDDKSHVKALKERYQQYDLICEDNEYDDEYDDSYDALADSESKLNRTRIGIGKDLLVDELEPDDGDEEEDESSEENNEGDNKNDEKRDTSKDFCENPEVIRARYEAKRAAKYNRGGFSGNKFNQSRNVVGNPKGQGQDEKTLNNRHKKEVNKSSRANHNRKSGASWKRNRGMIPS
ncbi:activating signal cointegrator 1 complex subunit 2 [Condylostylus longicornis]|uniref:activating signal cointegrator 1 complex subunit 2 n=1 Tax=Condylostylus longicornis TaxID=2530218 RepID=UPI00244E2BE2|nr:activating signal cointegrator 1 complex subunit 2 [Condylostylus longicornis]